jgi:hypothetical protein
LPLLHRGPVDGINGGYPYPGSSLLTFNCRQAAFDLAGG